MERLTFEGNFCDIAKCQETPGGSFCENGMCSQRKVWERLKHYEDMEEQGRLVVLENAEHRNAVVKFYDRLKTDGDWMVQALKGGAE